MALSKDRALDPTLLPSSVAKAAPGETRGSLTLRERMDACERGIIVEALRACRNDRTEAARSLRISRVTIHDRLRSAAWRCPGEGSPAGEQ